jgi:phage terminase Nu1 subunit (DNA packaging protein)
MPTVDVNKVASALNLSPQRVQQLVKMGMPREARGEYDPIKCMAWYVRFLQRAIERKTMPTLEEGDEGERAARVRILRAQADEKEMALAKLRSQLLAIQDVEKEINRLVLTTTAHIMAIPQRLAPELVGETSRVMVQAKIEKALKQALSLLAREGGDAEAGSPQIP